MSYVYVGKLQGTHGVKGELKFKSDFIYKSKILKKDLCFYIGNNREKVKLLSFRKHNELELLLFKDINSIDLAKCFVNDDVYVLRDDLNLRDNEYVFEDYIGLKAYNNDNYIGIISDIVDYGNKNYVFHVDGEKEILIPLNDKFIKKVELSNKIVFKEIEGIIDAN